MILSECLRYLLRVRYYPVQREITARLPPNLSHDFNFIKKTAMGFHCSSYNTKIYHLATPDFNYLEIGNYLTKVVNAKSEPLTKNHGPSTLFKVTSLT